MVDQGRLDYDALVTDYWPEFGKNGKGHIKIEDVLRHEAGLAAASDIDLAWTLPENIKKNMIGKLLEDDTPVYYTDEKKENPTGVAERHYHAVTRDLITNELFRRVESKRRTMGEYLREEMPELDGVFAGIQTQDMHRVSDLWVMPLVGIFGDREEEDLIET